MLIETETTPNPATLKFMPGRKVMEAGTRDFASPEAAEASPLAEAIFSTGEVEGVFFGRDFVSVTAAPGVEWRAARSREVLEVLLDHFAGRRAFVQAGHRGGHLGRPRRVARRGSGRCRGHRPDQGADRNARPAGGRSGRRRHRLSWFKDGTVYLAIQGACSGCPSSTITLKRGIESLIKHYVPEVETIEAI